MLSSMLMQALSCMNICTVVSKALSSCRSDDRFCSCEHCPQQGLRAERNSPEQQHQQLWRRSAEQLHPDHPSCGQQLSASVRWVKLHYTHSNCWLLFDLGALRNLQSACIYMRLSSSASLFWIFIRPRVSLLCTGVKPERADLT